MFTLAMGWGWRTDNPASGCELVLNEVLPHMWNGPVGKVLFA